MNVLSNPSELLTLSISFMENVQPLLSRLTPAGSFFLECLEDLNLSSTLLFDERCRLIITKGKSFLIAVTLSPDDPAYLRVYFYTGNSWAYEDVMAGKKEIKTFSQTLLNV